MNLGTLLTWRVGHSLKEYGASFYFTFFRIWYSIIEQLTELNLLILWLGGSLSELVKIVRSLFYNGYHSAERLYI